MKRQQDTKEIYLAASGIITGLFLGVLVSMWPELTTALRGIFIFYSCVFAFMTYATKTSKVTEDKPKAKDTEQ